jgi:hypothetical protein
MQNNYHWWCNVHLSLPSSQNCCGCEKSTMCTSGRNHKEESWCRSARKNAQRPIWESLPLAILYGLCLLTALATYHAMDEALSLGLQADVMQTYTGCYLAYADGGERIYACGFNDR